MIRLITFIFLFISSISLVKANDSKQNPYPLIPDSLQKKFSPLKIDFDEDNSLLKSGWWGHETHPDAKSVRWGMEKKSTVFLELITDRPYFFTLRARTIDSLKDKNQTIKIFFNDDLLDEVSISVDWSKKYIKIPAEKVKNENNLLIFQYKYFVDLSENPESADTRSLSVLFDYLLVQSDVFDIGGKTMSAIPVQGEVPINILLSNPHTSQKPVLQFSYGLTNFANRFANYPVEFSIDLKKDDGQLIGIFKESALTVAGRSHWVDREVKLPRSKTYDLIFRVKGLEKIKGLALWGNPVIE